MPPTSERPRRTEAPAPTAAVTDRDQLLDIEQAARLLGVSETSLRRWTNTGRLACLRVGGKRERRFRREDLMAFVEEQPAHGSSTAPRSPPSHLHHTAIGGIPVPCGSHLCALYASDSGRVDLAVAFLADGLRPGTVCYLVAAPDARTHILARLEHGRSPLRQDIDAGRLVISEYAASPSDQHAYWEANFVAALRAGAHALRVVGDVWGGVANGMTPDEIVEYEEGYDRLLARRFPVVTLCQYDARRFSGLGLFRALRQHEAVFRYPVERLLA